MGKKTVLLSLILGIALFTRANRSFSGARPPRTPADHQHWVQEQNRKHKQRFDEFQRQVEEQRGETQERQKASRKITEEYSDEAYREAVGATAEQWRTIKPRFERARQLANTPAIRIGIYSFGGSGSYSTTSSAQGSGQGRGTGSSGQHSASAFGGGGSAGGSGFAGGGGGSVPAKKTVGDLNLGWQWGRPSLNKGPDTLTEGERACEHLLDLLEKDGSNPEEVRRRVETLRQARERQRHEWRDAQEQLRAVVTPEQEARLILMGYLD
ncbi:MAG: hypothetical protein FJ280_07780 [Planctomycetes bacterium]|nr:hypothetical protein [Planctomycetota bacterium]